MEPGHAFTIEPMINVGSYRDKTWPDNWTSVTEDGKRSAQFEETMMVTEEGVDILTMRNNPKPYFARQLDELGIEYNLKIGPGGSDPKWQSHPRWGPGGYWGENGGQSTASPTKHADPAATEGGDAAAAKSDK